MEASGALIQSKDTGRILLLLRGPHSSNSGTWAFVGGGIDDGESPLEALEREVWEEIGVKSGLINYSIIGKINSYADNRPFHLYYGSVDNEFKPTIDNYEHSDWGWYDLDYLPINTYPGLDDEIEFVFNSINGKRN